MFKKQTRKHDNHRVAVKTSVTVLGKKGHAENYALKPEKTTGRMWQRRQLAPRPQQKPEKPRKNRKDSLEKEIKRHVVRTKQEKRTLSEEKHAQCDQQETGHRIQRRSLCRTKRKTDTVCPRTKHTNRGLGMAAKDSCHLVSTEKVQKQVVLC